jgi:hypothetical protein
MAPHHTSLAHDLRPTRRKQRHLCSVSATCWTLTIAALAPCSKATNGHGPPLAIGLNLSQHLVDFRDLLLALQDCEAQSPKISTELLALLGKMNSELRGTMLQVPYRGRGCGEIWQKHMWLDFLVEKSSQFLHALWSADCFRPVGALPNAM